MRFSSLLISVALAALSACAVGPDFERPAAPDTATYDPTPLPDTTAATPGENGEAQKFIASADIPSEWWKLFHSKPLDELIERALKSNPDIAAAAASLRAASEDVKAGEGILFPTVTGNFNTTRQKTSGASNGGEFPGFLYTLHNASVDVSYGLDLFGGSRRSIEKLEAQEDYQRFELESTYQTLVANVVTTAIQEASLRGQIAATKKIIDDEGEQLKLAQQQFTFGGVSRSAVLAQQTTLEQTEATLPSLEQKLALTRHALSVLCGDVPSRDPQAKFDLTTLKLPKSLPVSLPSKLVEQRPDIRAAEASLHAASAAIGVAEANRLPQITLSADIGDVANNLGRMFFPGSGIWSAGFNVAQTLFDAGTLAHEQGSAEAEYDAAEAQYRKTVLTAFQNVADTLQALQSDATTLAAYTAAEHTASDSLKLASAQFDAGATSHLELLTAETAEQQTRIALVQAEAQRFADTAALFQALGGGWWNKVTAPDAPSAETPSQTGDNDPPHSVQAWRHE